MTISFALLMDRMGNAQDPLDLRDLMLSLGFNGLVFQRWGRETIENWEGQIPRGFLELYYGEELDEHCPIARAIHTWSRSYSFTEARAELTNTQNAHNAGRAERLFSDFGMHDGVVILTGSHTQKSSVILTSAQPCDEVLSEIGGLLHFGAHRLTQMLYPGHPLLSLVPRQHPNLSSMQTRIIQMQIDHPEMSSAEMAQELGMSPKTLHAHHKKIAKKTGVTTFAGAVLKHIQQNR